MPSCDAPSSSKLDLIGVSNVTPQGVEQALELVEITEVHNAYSIL